MALERIIPLRKYPTNNGTVLTATASVDLLGEAAQSRLHSIPAAIQPQVSYLYVVLVAKLDISGFWNGRRPNWMKSCFHFLITAMPSEREGDAAAELKQEYRNAIPLALGVSRDKGSERAQSVFLEMMRKRYTVSFPSYDTVLIALLR